MESLCKVCGGAHITGACTEKPKSASVGKQVKDAFRGIAGGIREGALSKIAEYDKRIRAAKEGKPIKAGDTATNLLSDFKRFARQDWADDFDMGKYRGEQPSGDGAAQSISEPMGVIDKERTELVDSEKVNAFILKLAEATNRSDGEVVDAIVKQIRLLEDEQNFPDLLASLDPDQYSSQTKSISEEGRQRLQAALDKYIKEKGQK